jgi:hypothetical protein
MRPPEEEQPQLGSQDRLPGEAKLNVAAACGRR